VTATTTTELTNRHSDPVFHRFAILGAPSNSLNTTDQLCAVNTVALITTGHANTAPVRPKSTAAMPYVWM
jgi:hypothetical protein